MSNLKLSKRGKLERFFRRGQSAEVGTSLDVPLGLSDPKIAEELKKAGVAFPLHGVKVSKRASHTGELKSLTLDPSLNLKPVSAITEIQGRREYMEDRCIAIDNLRKEFQSDKYKPKLPYSYWAVYDGHAGFRAAEIAKQKLHKIIVENENFFTGNVGKAIQESLVVLDTEIIQTGIDEGWTEGCCVSIVIIIGTVLYSANLGDSHMILSRNINRYEAIVLSEAHKASVPSEKQRITKAGGMVMRNRVFGDLSISRALGDLNYKIPKQEVNYVSNEAYCRRISLTQNNHFIILASDGLWDTVSPKEAINMLYSQKSLTSAEMSKLLVDESFNRGSEDNITVIVVILNWDRNEEEDDDDPLSDPL